MTASGPLSPGAVPPERPDPLAMSVAEKLACEWEARHDVVARGGRLGDPAAVAHYFTHARSVESAHPHHPDADHARHHHEHGHHGFTPEEHLRSWVRWGEDGP